MLLYLATGISTDLGEEYNEKIWVKNNKWFSSYSFSSPKFSPICWIAYRSYCLNEVKFQTDVIFEIVRILSLNFSGAF